MPEAAHCQLPLWLNPGQRKDTSVDLSRLKAELARQGINSRGWRLYLDYGDTLFSPLGRPWIHPDQTFASGPNALAYLRILQACEMDVLPPLELVASMPMWRLPNDRLDCIPPLFFRAAWKAAVANQYAQLDFAEFITELISVCSWFFATGTHETADVGLLKAGWPTLLRRYEAWLREQTRQVSIYSSPVDDEWNPYIRRVEWGLYRFQALTTAGQLREEGETMQHCVGNYADYCRAGVKRIYSVRERKSGPRLATLAIAYITNRTGAMAWEFDQMSGLKNAEILPPSMFLAADAVLRAYFDLPHNAFSTPVMSARAIDDDDDGEWNCDF